MSSSTSAASTSAASTSALMPGPGALDRDPMWAARLAFESRRRTSINTVVQEIRQGKRAITGVFKRAACACASDEMCWQGACTTTPTLTFPEDEIQVATQLVGVVAAADTSINVLVDASAGADARQAALAVAGKFASTFALELEIVGLAGHTGGVDRDGDGRLTVVFTNTESSFIDTNNVGFFSHRDFLSAGDSDASGNQADLLWARIPATVINGRALSDITLAGTLAHEYLHLASFGIRVQNRPSDPLQEILWLDEGLAHLVEDLTGWGPSNVRPTEAALLGWADGPFAGPEDTSEQRGRAYLLLRHMVDTAAKSATAEHAATHIAHEAAASLVSSLLAEAKVGWEHQALQNLGSDGVWHWLLGVFSSCNAGVTSSAALAHSYLPRGKSAITGNHMGFDPFGEYSDDRGDSVVFGGVSSEELDDSNDGDDYEVALGGTALFTVLGSDGTGVDIVQDVDNPLLVVAKKQQIR